MNIYVSKYQNAWELALGNTPEEAAATMDLHFNLDKSEKTKVADMKLYGQLKGENRVYYYGYVDPRDGSITYPEPDHFIATYDFQHPIHLEFIKEEATT